MRTIALLMLAMMSLSACGTTVQTVANEWYMTNVNPSGSTSYDPPNGDWIFIRNEPLAAQRQFEREGGWKGWGDPTPPKY